MRHAKSSAQPAGTAKTMAKELSKAQVNHLRRLLGWVRCEIPPAPEEIVKIVHDIAPAIDSEDGKRRLVEWHREAQSVPKYIRAALKSLEPLVKDAEGELIDAETRREARLEPPKRGLPSI